MLNCDLRVGLATDHIDHAAEQIEGWLDRRLDFDSDQGRGGVFYKYETDPQAEGINAVRVSQNYVEGNGWVYDTDARLKIFVEVFARLPHIFDLGRWLVEMKTKSKFDVAPLAYVVRPERALPNGRSELMYAHIVEFDAQGRPKANAAHLRCQASFSLHTNDFSTLVQQTADALEATVESASHTSQARLRSAPFGKVTIDRPARRDAPARLQAHWSSSDVLQFGLLSKRLERVAKVAQPLGYEVEGALMNGDNKPQVLRYTAPSK
ncbi:MAG: hypothetical protein AAFN74_17025 [Myxococcota bacterium]